MRHVALCGVDVINVNMTVSCMSRKFHTLTSVCTEIADICCKKGLFSKEMDGNTITVTVAYGK